MRALRFLLVRRRALWSGRGDCVRGRALTSGEARGRGLCFQPPRDGVAAQLASRLYGVLWCAGILRNVYYASPLCVWAKTGRRRQPLLGLIRVFEAGAIRARA